jgi:hypothetical protein
MTGGQYVTNGAVRTESMTTGLSPLNVDKLDSEISEARQIDTTADTLQTAFGDLGDFKAVKSTAEKFITNANKLLTKYKKPTA